MRPLRWKPVIRRRLGEEEASVGEAQERRNAAALGDRACPDEILELVSGLEPLTYALRMRCSTS